MYVLPSPRLYNDFLCIDWLKTVTCSSIDMTCALVLNSSVARHCGYWSLGYTFTSYYIFRPKNYNVSIV